MKLKFELEFDGGESIAVKGNFTGLEFEFKQGSRGVVARVSKKAISAGSDYRVEVEDEIDPVPLLASVVAISRNSDTRQRRDPRVVRPGEIRRPGQQMRR